MKCKTEAIPKRAPNEQSDDNTRMVRAVEKITCRDQSEDSQLIRPG